MSSNAACFISGEDMLAFPILELLGIQVQEGRRTHASSVLSHCRHLVQKTCSMRQQHH